MLLARSFLATAVMLLATVNAVRQPNISATHDLHARGSPSDDSSRVVVYYQTQYNNGSFVSLRPLIDEKTGVTHVIIAAIHLDEAGVIHLNNDSPSDPKFKVMWEEVAALQNAGVKVLGMVGGAASGSFSLEHLDSQDVSNFESAYSLLKKMVTDYKLDGLDLDVEENMTIKGMSKLIERLKRDLGDDFIITMAPVATALHKGKSPPNISGFNYHVLEAYHGDHVAWYNAQFYCSWGYVGDTKDYDAIIESGLPASKVVLGTLTNKENGGGYVKQDVLVKVVKELKVKYPDFGGVAAWEYYNSKPNEKKPWLWAKSMREALKSG